MGKKLDALFGMINHKWASKMKTMTKLAACRLVMIKNQHQIRFSYARSDVAQLLSLGHQKRALLRVQQLIEEQNKLDAFVILDDYFHVLQEKAVLVEKNKECPEELKEAMSSLIYAASRCGQFPELQEIRNILTSKFGNEFATNSLELTKNCRVNPKIIQKLSSKQTSPEIINQVLREIALENGIALLSEGMTDFNEQEMHVHEDFSDSVINRKKYTDFAAVELSTSPESIDENSNINRDKSSSDDLRSYGSEEVEETDDDDDESKNNIEFTRDEGQILQPNEEHGEDMENVDDMKLLEHDHLDGQDMKCSNTFFGAKNKHVNGNTTQESL